MSFFSPSVHLRRSESHFTAADPRQSQVLKCQVKSHSSVENSTSMKLYDQITAQLGVLRKLSALHTYGSSSRWKDWVIPVHRELIRYNYMLRLGLVCESTGM